MPNVTKLSQKPRAKGRIRRILLGKTHWQRVRESNPLSKFRVRARFRPKLAPISALTPLAGNRHFARFAQNYAVRLSDFVRKRFGLQRAGGSDCACQSPSRSRAPRSCLNLRRARRRQTSRASDRPPDKRNPQSQKRNACGPRVLQCDGQLATSRLLFLAEFLESGIRAQRVPHRIEPKKGGRNGR